MSKTTELVERLRELPRDTRKATVEIYDLCIEASYEIEGLTDRCARYAEEIALRRGGTGGSAGHKRRRPPADVGQGAGGAAVRLPL